MADLNESSLQPSDYYLNLNSTVTVADTGLSQMGAPILSLGRWGMHLLNVPQKLREFEKNLDARGAPLCCNDPQ